MERRARWIIAGAALVGGVSFGGQALFRHSRVAAQSPVRATESAQPDPIAMVTESVAMRPLAGAIQVSGQVIADEARTVHVSPRVAGKVIEVRAKVGDTVHPGEVIATVASTDLQQARASYDQAKAKLEISRRTLEIQRRLA